MGYLKVFCVRQGGLFLPGGKEKGGSLRYGMAEGREGTCNVEGWSEKSSLISAET